MLANSSPEKNKILLQTMIIMMIFLHSTKMPRAQFVTKIWLGSAIPLVQLVKNVFTQNV